ncbi:MAG: CoB--CoM heterodisulfide reductase iron-sulfur subunit B family protein [Candidatus Bipolaricaulia bacterium]
MSYSYTYYPGCALKRTARHYEESFLAVFDALELEVEELEGWNCCGATAYASIDELKAFSLAARNLALAEAQGKDVVVPCSGCHLVLNKAKHYIHEYPEIGDPVNASLRSVGLEYQNGVAIRHPLDILINDLGLEEIAARVKRPLTTLKVAPYYGCQIVRPYKEFGDPWNPTTLDRLLNTLGADVVDYPFKTRCCGGSLTGTLQDVGLKLNHTLLKEARKREANVMTTLCPLCQFNLECYQDKIEKRFEESVRMLVVFFTQLVGLALGIPKKKLGLKRLFTPIEPVLART